MLRPRVRGLEAFGKWTFPAPSVERPFSRLHKPYHLPLPICIWLTTQQSLNGDCKLHYRRNLQRGLWFRYLTGESFLECKFLGEVHEGRYCFAYTLSKGMVVMWEALRIAPAVMPQTMGLKGHSITGDTSGTLTSVAVYGQASHNCYGFLG